MNTGRRAFITAGSAAVGALALRRPVRAAGPFRIIITETQIPLVPTPTRRLTPTAGRER